MIDYYEILGIKTEASLDEIKKAYRIKAQELHPDKNLCEKYFEEKFKDLQEAYSVLSDEYSRSEYDRQYTDTLEYLIKQTLGTISLPEESFPDYIKGIYLINIKEYKNELVKLYSSLSIVDDLMYKSYAFNEFKTYWYHRSKANDWEDNIRYLLQVKAKDFLEVIKNPINIIDDADSEEFAELLYQELIEKNNKKVTRDQIIIRCIYLTGKSKNIEQRKILLLEYLNIVERFGSYLENKYSQNIEHKNNSEIAKGLRLFARLLKIRGTDSITKESLLKNILSFFGTGKGPEDEQLMTFLSNDKPEDKIDNIITITTLLSKVNEPDIFSINYAFGLAYLLNRLRKYADGNINILDSVDPLKDSFKNYLKKLIKKAEKENNMSDLAQVSFSIDHLAKNILDDPILCKQIRKL